MSEQPDAAGLVGMIVIALALAAVTLAGVIAIPVFVIAAAVKWVLL